MSKALFLLLLFPLFCIGQTKVCIQDILITGLKHTKEKVILKELDFKKKDSIDREDIMSFLAKNENRIKGTGLFNSVDISPTFITETDLQVNINIIENWYIYPAPIFELADRNFNVWWDEFSGSLSRVNYGVSLNHYNLFGWNDPIKFKLQFGYTKKYEIKYTIPDLINNSIGFAFNTVYSQNKEIPYITESNITRYQKVDDERVMLSRFRSGASVHYRPSTIFKSSFYLEYHQNEIADTVAISLNQNYFNQQKSKNRFFSLQFHFDLDKRIYAIKPISGYRIFINLKKDGLGFFDDFNNTSITNRLEFYHPISNKIVLATSNEFKYNLNSDNIPYAYNTALGWSYHTTVSGFEYYVQDGSDYIISKNNISFNFANPTVKLFNFLPDQLRIVPMSFFLRFNFDIAYANEDRYILPNFDLSNNQSNRIIYGFGPALDFIIFNNFHYRFEYSFNDLNEHSLFIHITNAF